MRWSLSLKWLHILSSVLPVGTGLGSAYYLYFANRSREVAALAVVTRLVVRADWWCAILPPQIRQGREYHALSISTNRSSTWD